MKFRLLSDLHLEFERQVTDFVPPTQKDDYRDTVLILAGDIGVGTDAEPFIRAMSDVFYKVVFILGNHEFYHNEYYDVRSKWAKMSLPKNVHFLDNAVVEFDGVRIIGSTLWTDFNNGDWFSMQRAKQGMNDYHLCTIYRENRYGRLSPDDTVAAHKEAREFIAQTLQRPFEGKTIVVTHHLPHPICVHDKWKGSPLNSAYVSNLDDIIRNNDIAVWCHGHTHDNVDIEVHNTRILCNPRGYNPMQLNRGFDDDFTFEL